MKTIPVTIQNHTRLLDAEMVDRLSKGEIALKNTKGNLDELKGILKTAFKHKQHEIESRVQGSDLYYHFYDSKFHGPTYTMVQSTQLPAYPISAFFADEVPADVSREAKLQMSLEITGGHLYTSLKNYSKLKGDSEENADSFASNHPWFKKVEIALSDTTLVVVPETTDKDAAFVQMYEALRFCKEVINDVQQYIEFGQSAKQKFGEKNEKTFNEHTYNQIMNSDTTADTALAAADKFIKPVN